MTWKYAEILGPARSRTGITQLYDVVAFSKQGVCVCVFNTLSLRFSDRRKKKGADGPRLHFIDHCLSCKANKCCLCSPLACPFPS
jgi:hypothetical protein